jgi:REP element-mobilizing transposase RayT
MGHILSKIALTDVIMQKMTKYRNKYRVESTRLQTWDYGWNAAYFITICTKNRKHFFGEVHNGKMNLSEMGILANKFWFEIPEHFPFVNLDSFVVMPNHIHGIIVIDKEYNATGNEFFHREIIGRQRFQNQGKDTVSSIIGSYKSVVTKYARKINVDFGWQSRFHDHIIRNDKSYERIKNYIINNPAKWNDDFFNSNPNPSTNR